jgi:thiamine biosynthesis lipoprotein
MVKYSSPDTVNFKKEIEAILADIDTSMSTYNKQSVISRINNNQDKVKVDRYFKEVFEAAMKISKKTDGAFDITVGPLVNAWGFGQGEIRQIDSAIVDSIKEFVGYEKVRLKNGEIYKDDKRLKLNMNAIAQGYTVDVLAEFLDEKGIKNYLVEVGGEVRTKGISPSGRKWRIGIDKPVDSNYVAGQNLQAIVEIQNRALATSGNYRNFYIKDGVKYAHTIDPISGYPVTHKLLSASVFASDCVTADAYATAFMVMGKKKSQKLVERLKNIDAYFIYSDEEGNFKVDYSENLKGSITSVE